MKDIPGQGYAWVKLDKNVIPIVFELIYDDYIMCLRLIIFVEEIYPIRSPNPNMWMPSYLGHFWLGENVLSLVRAFEIFVLVLFCQNLC